MGAARIMAAILAATITTRRRRIIALDKCEKFQNSRM
jgi:hypothetical protein